MASYNPPKRATEYIFYVALRDQADTKLFKSSPTLAAGDVKVSKDGGALANLATLPTVTPAAGVMVKVTLSTTEMTADNVTVVFSDASGAEWCDLVVNIQPVTSNQFDDLSTVTTAQVNTEVDTALADYDAPTKAEMDAGFAALNDLSAAAVNAEVDTALTDLGLDHLVAAAVIGTDVVDNSIVAKLVSSSATADWDTYDNTTDSNQAIRDRGDTAWITGGGGGITDILNVQPLVPEAIDLANTATWRLGLMLTNAVDDLPTAAEIAPGTISIDRKAIGGTSWSAVVTDAACSETDGLIYYDEVFDSGSGYAEGDSIRITFKSQKITVSANDYEVTGTGGVIFYTFIRETERGTDSAYTGTPPTSAAIADQVWEEAIADHSGTGGSTAESLSGANAPSAADVADAVWDEAIVAHTSAGTTGEALDNAGSAASAASIAQAVWEYSVESGNPVNARKAQEIVRIMLAALVGAQDSQYDWGAKSPSGSKTRIAGTVSEGRRTSIDVLDGS